MKNPRERSIGLTVVRSTTLFAAIICLLSQLPARATVDSGTWAAQFDNAMRLRAEGRLKDAASELQSVLHGPVMTPLWPPKETPSKNKTHKHKTEHAPAINPLGDEQSLKNTIPDRRQYGDTLYACYSIYKMMDDWQSAAAMFKQAMARDSQPYSGHFADLASDYLELANCEYQLKQFKKSTEDYAKALSLRKSVYGPNSPYVGAVQWRYAKALRAEGRWQEASRCAEASYSTLPNCRHCCTNESVCPIYYGEKTYVVSPREFVRMDYFDGGKIVTSHSPHYWCTKCNRNF